jgi:hypothetical protein
VTMMYSGREVSLAYRDKVVIALCRYRLRCFSQPGPTFRDGNSVLAAKSGRLHLHDAGPGESCAGRLKELCSL